MRDAFRYDQRGGGMIGSLPPPVRGAAIPAIEDGTGSSAGNTSTSSPPVREPDPGTDCPLLRDTPQPACPRCTARHRGGRVMRLSARHEYTGRRHGYRLGPPDVGQDHDLRHLADFPEILANADSCEGHRR
ncbi:hypothetical protein [Actinoallomurus iriomotensis]|uniref:Uncharacterized protein n=1 Tax=Actinoallomurus iriomotensis TaxID=478107 RepID=A0A9W6W101_9ACTN|nr:hypothetical protein [Actinoallomurus iriomotensis]GLY87410.1 hypothetical protein Airi02_053390 [Actinoallomurus iriomotensis]